MASTDATAIPVKNQAYRVTFPIWDADGDLVTGATGLDSEVSKDAGTFADCTNEATEIATSSGIYYLDLTSTEMNADTVAIIVKTSSSGAKTTPIILYPQEAGDINVDVTYWNGTAVASPDTAGYPKVTLKSGTGTGEVNLTSGRPGINWGDVTNPTTSLALTGTTIATTQKVDVETIKTQAITCAAGVTVSPFVGSTGAAINGTNANTLSGHDPGATLGTSTLTQTQVTGGAYALNSSSFAFNAALDFTTTQKAATIATVTNLTNAPSAGDFTATMKTSIGTAVAASAVASVTGNVGGNVTGSVGSVVGAVGSVTGAVGSVTGNVGGNVVGSVGSVTAGVTLGDTAHGGTSATLRLGGSTSTPAFYVTNSGGDAVKFESTGGNGNAVTTLGHNTGAGLSTTGGVSGNGVTITGVGGLIIDGGTGDGVNIDGDVTAFNILGSISAATNALPWNASWDAEVQSEVQDAIEANHLDHLLAATYDPASKPGAADALLNELVESDAGVSRFTANALEQAPTGGSAPSAADIRAEIDSNSTQLAAILADTAEIGTAGAGLTALPTAADITTAVWAKAMTELSSVPGVTGSVLEALEWCFLLARNKVTQTSTTQTLRNDADSGSIGTATVSDDGTTATRGEWA